MNRFEIIKTESVARTPNGWITVEILKDKETGVLYLAFDGSITPLLDRLGNITVDR